MDKYIKTSLEDYKYIDLNGQDSLWCTSHDRLAKESYPHCDKCEKEELIEYAHWEKEQDDISHDERLKLGQTIKQLKYEIEVGK